MPTLFTIGHASRPVSELADLLRQQGVKVLVDVRTLPRSKTNPQFNKDALSQQLPAEFGIRYEWLGKELGGLRSRNKSSELNAGWDNAAFRGYADYMQTPAFQAGVASLASIACSGEPTAIMCAETVYWQCHRALLSDALTAWGWEVLHIISKDKAPYPHKVTKFAQIQGEEVTYPAYDKGPEEEGGSSGSSTSRAKRGAAADEKQPKIDSFFKRQGGQKRAAPEAQP